MHYSPLEQRFAQLVSLIDLGLLEASPREQLRRIVGECAAAMDADFAEIFVEDEAFIVVAHPSAHPVPDGEPIASAVGRRTNPAILFTSDDRRVEHHPVVRTLKLASMMVWPLQAAGKHASLIIGWPSHRSRSLTEEESRFMDFLATMVSRLLAADEKQRALTERVDRDALTGLQNRAALLERLAETVSAARRSGTQAGLLYVDLDRFKEVNDTHGHALGDAALAEAGRRMRSVLRRHEVAGRIGGDEFAVIVAPLGSPAEMEALASRLQRALRAPMHVGNTTLEIGASMGSGVFPRDADSAQDLLAFADRAMYAAKRGTPVLDPAPQPATVDPQHFDSQYILCVQPIVDARTRRAVGGEILSRWLDRRAGLLQPHALLGGGPRKIAAELDRRTLQLALRESSEIAREFGRMQLFVNIDEADAGILEAANVKPAVCLEIAEERVAAHPDAFIAFIKAARRAGFKAGLSGFGTSDISLKTLARLELDFVKINPRRIGENGMEFGDPRAVRTMIDHARTLAALVIAESIESALEAELVTTAGVDALQGYAICSPLTALDFVQWLRYRS